MAKFAVILNGDTGKKHLDNVARSSARLKEHGFTVFVASPQKPFSSDEYMTVAAPGDFLRLIDKLARRIKASDELVVYTTGHGGPEGLCAGSHCSDLSKRLDSLPFRKRFVIMDQCYSGNWQRFFVDDGRTAFASAGSKDETVCCQEYAPRICQDHDGSWR